MKKILSNILLAFAALVFLGAVVFVIVGGNSENFYMFGYKPFIVASGSMETEYLTYSMVVVQQGGYDDIQVDDVIAFKSEVIGKRIAFHRVVSKTNEGFITKGDNNSVNDGLLVTRENFIGHEVFHTNWTAYYIQELHKPFGIVRMVILPIIAIILLSVGIMFFCRWRANIWLKRLIASAIVFVICITSLISYTIWDNQRIIYLNDKLGASASEFLATPSATPVLDNHAVIGVIQIPSISIKYPIIEYENRSSLNVSITKYSGPPLNEIGNVVLAGHYSANGGNLFFTNINKLRIGDIATITDHTGRSIDYYVNSFDVHLPDDLSVLQTSHDNERELTLISCTTDLQNRYVVKLVATE
ncbi:signal peptidase I [Candidatus Saccharibacteria bacterium]|nr:signal peptidase I [Candidatus Saccharibacteria bacterium]